MAEYYCWAKRDDGANILERVRFQCVEVCIPGGFPCTVHTRIVNHTYTQFQLAPDLPGGDYFRSRRVSVFTRPESARDSVDIRLTQVLIYNGYIAQATLVKTRVRRSHPRRTMSFSFWSANGFFCVAAYAASSQVSKTITCWIH